MSGQPLLEARSIDKQYFGSRVVKDVTLEIRRAQITALIGPNGAGKTTLFDILAGFVSADRGKVLLDGEEVTSLPAYQRARRGLVKTFQIPHEFSSMSVEENLLVSASGQIGERFPDVLWRLGAIAGQERALRKRAAEILEFLELSPVRQAPAGALPIGQKKLLELARVLMLQPRVLLLDEPLAGVPAALGNRILDYLQGFRERGLTLCVVEHNLEAILGIADQVYVLVDGALLAAGPPADVQRNEQVQVAYLGG